MSTKPTFEPAEDTITNVYFEELRLIVRALGHKSCFITDESVVADFLPMFGRNLSENREEILKKAKKKLRIDLKPNDKLIKIAKRLRKENNKKETTNEKR